MNHALFMQSALQEAQKALRRGEFPVGCVFTNRREILAAGSRKRSRSEGLNELDHAEMVGLRRLIDLAPPDRMEEICVFTTLEPCLMCYSALLVNGIRTIVYAYEDRFGGGTALDLTRLTPLYRSMDIQVVPGVLRKESLSLFRTFFSDPGNTYLRESPLARQVLREEGPLEDDTADGHRPPGHRNRR